MAAPSPPRPFAPWRVEALFLSAALSCLLASTCCILSLQTQTSLHVQVLRCCEIIQKQCSRPYGTVTCILQTAVWLGTCRSIVTQKERSSELVLVCHRVSPFSLTTCSPEGPMFLEWPLTQPGGPVQPEHSLSQEDANGVRPGNAHLPPPDQRWRPDALQPPSGPADQGHVCSHSDWRPSMRFVEHKRASWLYCLLTTIQEQKHNHLTRLARNNDIISLQEAHGKDEFLQAVQILHTQLQLFGTFTLNNVNAGGSAIFIHKNLLPDGATVTHVTTCRGRDHIV